MPDLATLANLAEIFGALTVIGGAAFALIQIREFRRRRQDAIAVELMRTFYSPELAVAVQLIQQLPEGVSLEELRGRGPEYEPAAILISTSYETMGLLVYRRIAPFELTRQLTGGLTVLMFGKLRVWLEGLRVEQGSPRWGEWFQWLTERFLEAREHDPDTPANVRHADWKPRP